MRRSRWDDANGVLSYERITELYPRPGYRTSRDVYEVGRQTASRTKAYRVIVLTGTITVRERERPDRGETVGCGEILELEAGEYLTDVVGDQRAEVAMVWDLRA